MRDEEGATPDGLCEGAVVLRGKILQRRPAWLATVEGWMGTQQNEASPSRLMWLKVCLWGSHATATGTQPLPLGAQNMSGRKRPACRVSCGK